MCTSGWGYKAVAVSAFAAMIVIGSTTSSRSQDGGLSERFEDMFFKEYLRIAAFEKDVARAIQDQKDQFFNLQNDQPRCNMDAFYAKNGVSSIHEYYRILSQNTNSQLNWSRLNAPLLTCFYDYMKQKGIAQEIATASFCEHIASSAAEADQNINNIRQRGRLGNQPYEYSLKFMRSKYCD